MTSPPGVECRACMSFIQIYCHLHVHIPPIDNNDRCDIPPTAPILPAFHGKLAICGINLATRDWQWRGLAASVARAGYVYFGQW